MMNVNTIITKLQIKKLFLIFGLIFILFVLNFYFSEIILNKIIADISVTGIIIFTNSIEEIINIRIFLSFILTILILLPIFFIFFYYNIKDALYCKERKIFYFILVSLFLGYSVLYYGYKTIIYWFIPVFLDFNSSEILNYSTTITNLINFIILFLIMIFIIIQIPIIIKALTYTGIVHKKKIKEIRMPFYLISFIIVMFITPQDMLSSIIFQIPIILLYEIGLLI